MRTLVFAILLPLIASAQYMTHSEWVAKQIQIDDPRIGLTECGSDEGLFGIQEGFRANYTYYCSADTLKGPLIRLLIIKKGTDVQYYELSGCTEKVTSGDASWYGQSIRKCGIQKMDARNLKPFGRIGVITYTSNWQHDVYFTRFKFKMDNTTYIGSLVPVIKIRTAR